MWASLSMPVSSPRSPGSQHCICSPRGLVGGGGVGMLLEASPSAPRPRPCTLSTPVWGRGLHMHTHTTDSHAQQLEAFCL